MGNNFFIGSLWKAGTRLPVIEAMMVRGSKTKKYLLFIKEFSDGNIVDSCGNSGNVIERKVEIKKVLVIKAK